MTIKKLARTILATTVAALFTTSLGCSQKTVDAPKAQIPKTLILSTTTSTENSGLLDFILPAFKEETGIEVKVVAVGTGKALQLGRDGEVDVLLAHAKEDEEKFVGEGHGLKRYDVMYNDFVLVGPQKDPSGVSQKAGTNIDEALRLIYNDGFKFVSRGDDSGTHKLEKKIWNRLGLEPQGENYISAGKGMGDVMQMASEMLAYTISDRATYLAMRDKLELAVLVEGDKALLNQYGVIAVNPEKNDKINKEGAALFVKWLLSGKAQDLIAQFGKDKYGQSLFIPNAKE